jgi:antitoxin component of RelBE/YafQ-DinJ toxin-antitoxin module
LGIKRTDARTILEKTLIQKRRLPTNPRLLDDELLSMIEEGI